ncbi:KOW motif-containing protein [Actinophytocola sp.]|uniref:KOW motif-containing protein n=1 Tax=Actinophytocola sp. TaxID=1872138 RepID=UPI003D6C6E33
MLVAIAIFAPIAACVLVFVALMLALRANNRLVAIQRQQAEEFARLRRAITELRLPSPGTPPDDRVDGPPSIGAFEPVVRVGDQVEIVDGPHRGEHGVVAPSPDWLREGVACVDLAGGRGPRYVEVSKLARWDETTRE